MRIETILASAAALAATVIAAPINNGTTTLDPRKWSIWCVNCRIICQYDPVACRTAACRGEEDDKKEWLNRQQSWELAKAIRPDDLYKLANIEHSPIEIHDYLKANIPRAYNCRGWYGKRDLEHNTLINGTDSDSSSLSTHRLEARKPWAKVNCKFICTEGSTVYREDACRVSCPHRRNKKNCDEHMSKKHMLRLMYFYIPDQAQAIYNDCMEEKHRTECMGKRLFEIIPDLKGMPNSKDCKKKYDQQRGGHGY